MSKEIVLSAQANLSVQPRTQPSAFLSRIEVLGTLLLAVFRSTQDRGVLGPLLMAKRFLHCALYLETFRGWFGKQTNAALSEMIGLRPSLIHRVKRPYLNAHWSGQKRLEVTAEHYRMLRDDLGFLRFAPAHPILLGGIESDVQIRLEKPGWFEHEGELAISLFLDDLRLYSLVFTLGQCQARRVAYVGALQGLGRPDARDLYRTLTHRMHGLRPRALLVQAFRMLAASVGVERILAISDRGWVGRSDYFGGKTVFSSYDSAWLESGGLEAEDGFFELTPQFVKRPIEDIPSRKRAQYRRRYEMLDRLSAQIGGSVQLAWHAHAVASANSERDPPKSEQIWLETAWKALIMVASAAYFL